MPKFFVPLTICEGETRIEIHNEDSRHIRDVLRMKAGEIITVCDSSGMDHECCIEAFEKDFVIAKIVHSKESDNESPFDIIIYQGLPKSDKMELIIQKCVELGGTRIVPVTCARSIVKLTDTKDIEKKVIRWSKIAYEAAKQCNRSIIPQIGQPLSFKEALYLVATAQISFIPWECEELLGLKTILKNSLSHLQKQNDITKNTSNIKPQIAFIIGPEGGFDQSEILLAKELGIPTISLGKRILRTETAAPAILAMILYETELS